MGTTPATVATSVAITSATNAQATVAIAAARQSAEKACTVHVKDYEHKYSTVSEMREYAGCIDRLYPSPMTEQELVSAKFVVLVIFVAMVAGVAWERKERSLSEGWLGAVVAGSIIGIGAALLGIVLLAVLLFGVSVLLA